MQMFSEFGRCQHQPVCEEKAEVIRIPRIFYYPTDELWRKEEIIIS